MFASTISQDRDIVLANTPETRELICKIPPFSNIKTYVEVTKVHYPSVNSQGKEGKGEGKEENENVHEFPTSTCIHPSLEGQDWIPIEDQQVAFISTDGTNTEYKFTRPIIQGHHFGAAQGPPPVLFPVFINEAAYQKSGVAFPVYKESTTIVP